MGLGKKSGLSNKAKPKGIKKKLKPVNLMLNLTGFN